MLKLGTKAGGPFVMIIEISAHLIRGLSGHITPRLSSVTTRKLLNSERFQEQQKVSILLMKSGRMNAR